jgi:peroxiredoxin
MDNPNNTEGTSPSPEPTTNTAVPAPTKISPILLLFLIFPLLGLVAAFFTLRGNAANNVAITPPPAYFTPTTRIGSVAPDFALKTLNGTSLTLSSQRGKWVFLNFWATWCPPCRLEMPTFQKLITGGFGGYQNQVTVLAVNRVETAQQITTFMQQYNLTVPVVMDEDAKINNLYGVLNLPVTFIIDPSGVVRDQVIGEMTADLIQQYLKLVGAPTSQTF